MAPSSFLVTNLGITSALTLALQVLVGPFSKTRNEQIGLNDVERSFGVQRHGLAIISEVLLEPSLKPTSQFCFQIQRGQILDFPIKNGRIMDASSSRFDKVILEAKAGILWPGPFPAHALLTPIEPPNMRWDVEPWWETDSQACCVNYRVDGLPVMQLSLSHLLGDTEKNDTNYVICTASCHNSGSPLHGEDLTRQDIGPTPRVIKLPDEDEGRKKPSRPWIQLPLADMLRKGQLAVAGIEGLKTPPFPNWFVQVGNDHMLALLASAVKFTTSVNPNNVVITNCLPAGLAKGRYLDKVDLDAGRARGPLFLIFISTAHSDSPASSVA